MLPRLQRDYKNQFSDYYWRAKNAIMIHDQAQAAASLQMMKALHEKAISCVIDDLIVKQFENDISKICEAINERH